MDYVQIMYYYYNRVKAILLSDSTRTKEVRYGKVENEQREECGRCQRSSQGLLGGLGGAGKK